jgi:hypothetical protein
MRPALSHNSFGPEPNNNNAMAVHVRVATLVASLGQPLDEHQTASFRIAQPILEGLKKGRFAD